MEKRRKHIFCDTRKSIASTKLEHQKIAEVATIIARMGQGICSQLEISRNFRVYEASPNKTCGHEKGERHERSHEKAERNEKT